MKYFLFFVALLPTGLTRAINYYVDPSVVVSSSTGTRNNPFISLSDVNKSMTLFKAGDTVFFKRGERFSGKLAITCSGKFAVPIVFMSFGNTVAAPVFQYLFSGADTDRGRCVITVLNSRYIVIDGLKISDTTMNPDDHTITAHVGYGILLKNTKGIILKNLEVSLVGVGIEIDGDSNVVKNCRIQNLRMVVNTATNPNDDYGAVAIVLGGANNEISNNLFKDCWAASNDYQYDGGGIELFGSGINNNNIVSNLVINCNGFMECGSDSGGECNNNRVAWNILINNGLLCYIHRSGKFGLLVNNLQFVNNLVIETVKQLSEPPFLIGIGNGYTATKKMIDIRQNIFWLKSGINFTRAENSSFDMGLLNHEENIYYLESGNLSIPKNSSEIVLTNKLFKAPGRFSASSTLLAAIGWYLQYWFMYLIYAG